MAWTIPDPLPYGPTQPREAFQPQVTVTDQEHGFRYDGIAYYGTGMVGTTRVYYRWVEEVETGRGPWERYEFDDLDDAGQPVYPNLHGRSEVSRRIEGFRVYWVYAMPPELCALYDRAAELYAARPPLPRDPFGSVIDMEAWRDANETTRRQLRDAGCDGESINAVANALPRSARIGCFLVDGLERSEQIGWYGPRATLFEQSPEFRAWVASIPECDD